ncbi:MAG: hypothetical protein ACRDV9_12985, partial [Acidimicrobiia bacterium]
MTSTRVTPTRAEDQGRGRKGSGLRRHRLVLVVLSLGLLHRLAVAHAYPVFVFPDSQVYLSLAHPPDGGLGFSPGRPSGYSILLRLISAVAGPALGNVTTLQHLSGLLVGGLAYALLVRSGLRRGLAAAIAATLLLDGYVAALEHDLLADSFFGAAVFTSLYLAIVAGRRSGPLLGSGLLLAAAVLIRSAGLFVVPVWLAYLVIARRGWRAGMSGLAGLAAPILVYCLAHQAAGQGFAVTHSDGWFLYGRIAAIAQCDGARIPPSTAPLCAGPALGPVAAVWDGASAARRLFAPGPAPPIGEDYPQGMTAESNSLLRQWSIAVIREHPGPYLALVARDFLQYFRAGERGVVAEVTLPGEPDRLLWYSRHVHTVRWLAGLLLLIGLLRGAL